MRRIPPRGAFDYLLAEPLRPPTRGDVVGPPGLDRRIRERAAPPPPPPKPEPPRPPRVTINIEINDHRGGGRWAKPAQRAGFSIGGFIAVVLVLVFLLALLGCAHAETWTSYRQGFMTYGQGSDGSSARSYRQGFMHYDDITLPDGSQRHCQSYELSGTVHTECND